MGAVKIAVAQAETAPKGLVSKILWVKITGVTGLQISRRHM